MTAETTEASEWAANVGRAVTLPDGRQVALFRDEAMETNAIRFTNGERVTRIVLSDMALAALVALATGDDGGPAA